MHLVIDDQAPVAGVEDLEVGIDALPLGGHHLIRGNGDRANLLAGSAVLADLVGGERRATQKLFAPLACAHRVGDEDERRGLSECHGECADDGLACAAGEYDDTGTTVPKALGRFGLVRPRLPISGVKADGMALAIDITGDVLRRPAELYQCLLDVTALAGMYADSGVIEAGTEQRCDLLAANDLFEHGSVDGLQY